MNRWVGVGIVVALLIAGWFAYSRPELFPGDVDVTQLIWLLMALLLVGGGLYGRSRYAPITLNQTLMAILIWGGLIVAIMLAYSWFN